MDGTGLATGIIFFDADLVVSGGTGILLLQTPETLQHLVIFLHRAFFM
jgi:hypothetical protein